MVSLIDILKSAGKDLYKHQLDFVSDALWFVEPRILLADDVGLGKTIQALLYLKALLELKRVNHVLLVVPRAVLGQWSEELDKFGVPYYLIESPDFPLGHRVYLITLDRAKQEEYLAQLDRINWDLIVVDEAHKLRLKTLRSKIAVLCKRASGCLLLTATPHTGNEDDYRFLTSLVNQIVRREKKDVEEYEGRKIFPQLKYWIVQVNATREESEALYETLKFLERENIEPIVRVVVEKRAMSSPAAFFKTLGRVVGGRCDEELLEEGELDACLGNLAGAKGIKELAQKYAKAADRKLEALKRLLSTSLKGKKVLVFTEYATTAEYLYENLAAGCRVLDRGEGFAKADCGDVGIMYATASAREKIDVGREGALMASAYPTAVLISTDILSEGVNLQAFDVVVNYEVVWSPTKHVQRIGRIWRFGQKAPQVLVVDMVLKTRLERDEFSQYVDLMEKLYHISLRALPPQAYGEFEIYELDEELKKIVEVGSSGYFTEAEVYLAAKSGRLAELREKIETILKAREQMRGKSRRVVEEGLRAKLGYPPTARPEPGGGYYVAEVVYKNGGKEVYKEHVLVRLPTPLSKSRDIKEGVFRETEVDWDGVEGDPGEVKDDERSEVYQRIYREVWWSLSRYLRQYLGIEGAMEVALIRRANVVSLGEAPAADFDRLVWQEVRSSRNRARTEEAAARCVKAKLQREGYGVVEDYLSAPRPFDMVVAKGGLRYTVEVKGKSAGRRDDPISFTANEIDWASRFPDRHIVCIAYVDGDRCVEVQCVPFTQFQREWVLETVRGIEYKYNARRRNV